MKRAHKSDRRSLWSAVAWNRFGSHLQILQTHGTRDAVGFLSLAARVSKWTTKAVPSNRTPKAVAITVFNFNLHALQFKSEHTRLARYRARRQAVVPARNHLLTRAALRRPSENILQRELNLPLRARAGVDCARDRTKGRAGGAGGGEKEVRVIGQIEDFGAELELMPLRYLEEAGDAEVEVVQPGAARQVASRIAEHADIRPRARKRNLPGRAVA